MAFSLMQSGVFSELALIGANRDQAEGEAILLVVSNPVDVLEDICMSIPAVVGRKGVETTLDIPLSGAEREALRRSADTRRSVLSTLEL